MRKFKIAYCPLYGYQCEPCGEVKEMLEKVNILVRRQQRALEIASERLEKLEAEARAITKDPNSPLGKERKKARETVRVLKFEINYHRLGYRM